jgi:hypothetical protein
MRLIACAALLLAGCGDMTSHAAPMRECTEDCGSSIAHLPQGGFISPSPGGGGDGGVLGGPAIAGAAPNVPLGAPVLGRAGPSRGLAGNAGGAGGAANGGGSAGGAGGAANGSGPPQVPDAGFGPGGAIQ